MRLPGALFVVSGVLLVLPPNAGAQGLGDASKKEKERRQQSKTTKAKTYTQEELATLPPVANDPGQTASDSAPPPAVGSGGPIFPSESAPPGASANKEARRGDETQWRARVASAQGRVERARKQHETLVGMNLVPGYEYQDSRGRTVVRSVEELQKLTAAAKAELDAAEKALADLLEEARRAGVPPGWLR
jgi:hypothetical protein